MIYKVAELFVDVPSDGGMDKRCENYITDQNVKPDVVIKSQQYSAQRWPGLDPDHVAYMDSGWQFYIRLLKYGGMMLHSSAIELDGRAYLFSGPSGMGKSTHTRLWQEQFPTARVFNDDKPALRKMDGVWYAYGTPWCGKDGININLKVPIAGICFLRRGEQNSIRRLSPIEAVSAVLSQTMKKCKNAETLTVVTSVVDKVVREIPVYELRCTPTVEAAVMSHDAMSKTVLEDEK